MYADFVKLFTLTDFIDEERKLAFKKYTNRKLKALLATVEFRADEIPLDSFLMLARQKLSAFRSSKLHLCPIVDLSCDIRSTDVTRLTAADGNYIAVSLPVGGITDITMLSLRYLIHTRGLTPIIMNCEKNFIMYSERDLERIKTLSRAVYQISARALSDKEIRNRAKELADNGKVVLVATNSEVKGKPTVPYMNAYAKKFFSYHEILNASVYRDILKAHL